MSMASPESDKPALKSPSVKDSPIFGYVSSLSPIQPVNARPTSQLYGNIDVPSPQMVFKTPSFVRPRISSLLERSQHPSSLEYSNNTREFSDITVSSLSLSATQLISHNAQECTSGDPSPNQSCTSPSNCVDTFLTDPCENGENSLSSPEFCVDLAVKSTDGNNTDCCENQLKSLKKDLLQYHLHTSAILVNEKTDDNMENSASMGLPCLPSNQDAYPPHTLQDDSIGIEESPAMFHVADEEDGRLRVPYKTTDDPVNASMVSEVMESHKGSITEQMEPVPKNAYVCTNTFNTVDFTSHSLDQHATDHSIVSRAKHCDIPFCEKENGTSYFICQTEQNLKAQATSSGQSYELDCTPQLHLDSLQNNQSRHNHIDEVAQMPSASTGSQNSLDQEDCPQHQRGNRKRLQFEAAENLRRSSRNSFNCTTEASNVDSQITPLETGCVNSPLVESITMSSYKQMFRSVPGHNKASPAIVPRPTGIGLHLNSIGSAASTNCNSNSQPLERNTSVEEEKALGEDNHQVPEKLKKLSISSEKPLHYAANKNNEENQQGNQLFQLQHSSALSNLIDRCMTPCMLERIHSEEAIIAEESTQTSPRKKRKKASETDGHKRCNCKRSKCLKLYCDCFAAGSFCSEACACRDCSNRLEYEGTVLETRQHIESRNPLAFAPKVISRASGKVIKDITRYSRILHDTSDSKVWYFKKENFKKESKPITPTSARHKRGCNCKRSLCLKKYCECFQSGVGCSLGCRCEGCKNTFGMKDGCEISEMVVEHKGQQVSRNDMPKTQFPASYYDTENEYHNEGKVGTFSESWEGLEDLCNLSPFLKETCSPIKSVKATSPNQKRVSSPYKNTNSPSGIRSGRRFILKSVPTFPPLTPYSKSNGEDGT